MSFIDYFGEIPDPRKDINVKRNLLDVIFLTITAIISGYEGWKDIYDFGRVKLSWLYGNLLGVVVTSALRFCLTNLKTSRR